MSNLTEQLIEAGYKKHVAEFYKVFHSTDTLYQKRIDDERGKRYFINAWHYPKDEVIPFEALQFEVQFDGAMEDDVINVEISTNNYVLAEKEFDRIWKLMNYGYYELWDDV